MMLDDSKIEKVKAIGNDAQTLINKLMSFDMLKNQLAIYLKIIS